MVKEVCLKWAFVTAEQQWPCSANWARVKGGATCLEKAKGPFSSGQDVAIYLAGGGCNNAKSACNSTGWHMPHEWERAKLCVFSGVTLFCLSFGVVAACDHLQHLPCLTMKPSFIPRVEGLCSSSARLLRCEFLIEQIKQPATALASPPHCPPFATGLCVFVWCMLWCMGSSHIPARHKNFLLVPAQACDWCLCSLPLQGVPAEEHTLGCRELLCSCRLCSGRWEMAGAPGEGLSGTNPLPNKGHRHTVPAG